MTSAPRPTPPIDDGAYEHLRGVTIPKLALPSTTGGELEVCDTTANFTVVFLYPMTGTPGKPLPEGWMEIPGAFGCTAQSCAYRDLVGEFAALRASVRGISTQTHEEQVEFSAREHIPYPLLSDEGLRLTRLLELPTFVADDSPRIKRASLVIDRDRRVVDVLYPVLDPASNAADSLAALRGAAGRRRTDCRAET
jgi:peroxiredoxin